MKTEQEKFTEKFTSAVEEYQCPGCIHGGNIACGNFEGASIGIGCENHAPGTWTPAGKILLGLPTGFNRVGGNNMKPYIFETCGEVPYDKFNIPVWKYLDGNGNTIVRGLMPRVNQPFIHIFLEDCRNKINCIEITDNAIDEMD